MEADQELPANAQVAFQQADYAAWNIFASFVWRPLLPVRYQILGVMMVGVLVCDNKEGAFCICET